MKAYLKIKIILVSILFFFCLNARSQDNPVLNVGSVTAVDVSTGMIKLTAEHAYIEISTYSPSIIRIRLDKQPLKMDVSYAVVINANAGLARIIQNDNNITLETDSLKAVIQKRPYAIAFYTKTGVLINEDEAGLTTSWAGEEVTTYKKMQPGERFIGLGEKTGNIDRTGNGYTNWNTDAYAYSNSRDPIYSTIPFYMGIHHDINYGIFLDNTYQSDFNFGASNNRFSSFGARGGEMNYYFIYHKKVADIIKSYTYLTGRMPLPPLWSLGYQQNRYSYYPETEVMRIAQTLREKKIPADGITLDIHYMDQYQLFTWNKDRFPDPLGMTTRLKKMGFRTTVIVDPGIKIQPGAPAYERGVKDSVYLKYPDGQFYAGQVWPGWCNFTDFTSKKGRAWWGKEVKFFADNGISGIWNDMNEIATWGQKMPNNILFDYEGKKASNLQAHNVYGMQMARASYEGAKLHTTERPFVLTRAGYAGLQRYSAIWTGDNVSEDEHMILGIRLLSSLGLSGVPFTGMDVGGFMGNGTNALFGRWIEIGAFTPYFRNHTAYDTKSSEPWTYGESVTEISRNYIGLRYRLLPYLYSTFYEATRNGLPIVRSLAIDYTFDANIYKVDFQNQYLFGSSLMVAPFESNKEFAKVYFPKGLWYDLYNDSQKDGGKDEIVQLYEQKLPVYVRESSIIPMQSLIQSTAEQPTDTLVVHVYKGSVPNSFIYYEDDGISFNYDKGQYFKKEISIDPDKKTISFSKAAGSFKSKFTWIKLILHGFTDQLNLSSENKTLQVKAETYKFIENGDKCNVQSVIIRNGSEEIKINY